MTAKNLIIALIATAALSLGLSFYVLNQAQQLSTETHKAGASQINELAKYPTVTSAWVKTSDSLVVATNTARTFLKIGNNSGSTTTAPQTLYCNFGDRPATIYTGFPINASSSEEFTFDKLYTGAIHCIFPVGAANVLVTDF